MIIKDESVGELIDRYGVETVKFVGQGRMEYSVDVKSLTPIERTIKVTAYIKEKETLKIYNIRWRVI